MTLPNFLIIGAGRSGTTSLYEYLRQHPDVFMSDVKAPSYFAYMNGDQPVRGQHAKWVRQNAVTTREAYEKLFASAGSAKAIGEASPIYLNHPASGADPYGVTRRALDDDPAQSRRTRVRRLARTPP